MVVFHDGDDCLQPSAVNPFGATLATGVCVPDSCSTMDISILLNIGQVSARLVIVIVVIVVIIVIIIVIIIIMMMMMMIMIIV